ncbi:MAG: hypothetical protein JSS89_09305 [Bacteroidetes bacterium]|nr:hypothetical protein [Bacteroidota bacterium]
MKIKRGFAIARESWNVLKADPEMMVFPVLNGVGAIAVLATVLLASFLIPSLQEMAYLAFDGTFRDGTMDVAATALTAVMVFGVYYVEYALTTYFGTALVSCALMRFEGQDPTVADGFRMANARLPQILAWSAVAAFVGAVLSMIEQRLGVVGRIVIKLIGAAWAIATYFVVPIVAAQGLGPKDAVKSSVQLLKKTWGEGLVGNMALGVVGFVGFVLVVFATVIAIYFAQAADSLAFTLTLFAIGFAALVCVGIVQSTLSQIFLAGLYRYATTGEVPEGFSEATMAESFRSK